jgi:cysteine-rich repeat protein
MFGINLKSKKFIIGLIALIGLSLVLVNFQAGLTAVSATVIPVEVSIHHLDFGNTFPGENLEGNFVVSYAEQGNGINYNIIQKRKPLPPEHPEYPLGGDPLMPGYYRNLCPYLTKTSLEGEGDIEANSFVGPNDLTDKWTIYYSVPAIIGQVGQDHKGGLVTVSGEYGCDITINIEEYCGDGIKNRNEECDDGNDNNNDSCKNNCTQSSICADDLDVALVMDRSGSMGYTSICDWWQLKCNNPPSCSTGYSWVKNTTYNQTQAWCTAKNQSAPHNSIFTGFNPTKLNAVKQIGSDFLDLMGIGDQSALVSFANNATLDKQLSNNHNQTKTILNSLIPSGATDIGDAIKLATGELTSVRIDPNASQIMILLTDGMANKPSGSGFGEYAPDVTYALTKAGEAAAQGIKIFTIGLDSEINAVMLEQIADLTGGQYYFAPTINEIDDIFAMLKADICPEEAICGDGLKQGNEQCDGTDGVGEHQTCSENCTLINEPYCGDNIINQTSEQCDGTAGVGEHQSCSLDCTLTDLPYCGDGIINGNEACDDGNQIDTDSCKNDCTLSACKTDMDVMMVLDRSGSMGYISRCDWWQFKCNNPPSCSTGYSWVKNTTYNQTQSWCLSKNQSAPHNSVWTDYTPVKITAAKSAAKDFIDLLEAGDQSGLVSFANNATLDKQLSNNHTATKTSINSLVTNGATDIGDAIKLGALELKSSRAKLLSAKVMILLTDGMANKPYGSGSGENPIDVAYALTQAGEAAAAGIKIFTIGLGDEINAIMLGQIASVTGGQYYFAPSAVDLQDIFDQISLGFCQKITKARIWPWQISNFYLAIKPKELI